VYDVVETPFGAAFIGTAGCIFPFTGTEVVEADRACCPETAPETEGAAAADLLELAAPGPVGVCLLAVTALAYENARGAGALAGTTADVD
jgi:hypothetical protein